MWSLGRWLSVGKMNEEIDVGCGREEAAKASDELGSQNDIIERISSRRKMIEN